MVCKVSHETQKQCVQDLHKISDPIRIKLKSLFQGKLSIFRANCYFHGKCFRPPSKIPSRTLMAMQKTLEKKLCKAVTYENKPKPLFENTEINYYPND